jgi:ribosomal protein L37AE/L43A
MEKKQVEPLVIDAPQACDFCGRGEEVRYLDKDTWACAECARLYLAKLEWKG